MVEVPGAIPVTNPVVGLIVAIVVTPLLHTPPAIDAVNVPVCPVQIPVAPDIDGKGFTLMVRYTLQLPTE